MTTPANGDSPTPAIVAVACWLDLYNYGGPINNAGFDPSHADAKRPIARLRAFHRIVAEHSSGGFPTLVMNDGAVAYSDVELVRSDKIWRFVQRCWALYQAATDIDVRDGGPGLRAVIAVGLRARGSSRGIVAQEKAMTAIIEDLVAGRISAERAKAEARKVRRIFDIVPQLQANFAFTRAYEAEQSGKGSDFLPGNLYLDKTVFKHGVPSWITTGRSVRWTPKKESLRTSFVAIEQIEDVPNEAAHEALHTGRELLNLLSYPRPE